ncbi:MAG: serine/threonine protein kinase [Myxococcaceae bacterium]|nr:serine/threonine protein kinase [Myxococcaceae bacterium]
MAGLLDDDDVDGLAKTAPRGAVLDPDDAALIGRKLGDYRVDSVLGVGGMGIVFKGQQPLIKKAVAIKVLKRQLASEQSWASRLLDEARAANAIHHPGVVTTIAFGQAPDGRPYLVMDYLEGESLQTRLASRGKLPAVEALRLLADLLAPLEAAHAAGVIHRDLKPGNVFLQRLPDGKDFPRVLDFGLARHIDSTGRGSGIVGTPTYMAPEQARDGDQTPAIDLYALGCITYELLSGRPPFEAPSAWGLIELHLSRAPQPLATRVLDVDDEVAALVHELLDKDPARRPTAKQARREVARLLRAREEAATGRNEPVKVDRQDAATVVGVEGIDLPLPAPKRERATQPDAARPTDVHDIVARAEVPSSIEETLPDRAEAAVRPGPGRALLLLLIGMGVVGGALFLLFK